MRLSKRPPRRKEGREAGWNTDKAPPIFTTRIATAGRQAGTRACTPWQEGIKNAMARHTHAVQRGADAHLPPPSGSERMRQSP